MDDKEILNLDVAQSKEADNNLRRSTETVEVRLKETYCWLLAPYIDRAVDMRTIQWRQTESVAALIALYPKPPGVCSSRNS